MIQIRKHLNQIFNQLIQIVVELKHGKNRTENSYTTGSHRMQLIGGAFLALLEARFAYNVQYIGGNNNHGPNCN